jgi:hypothetical protein
MLHLFIKSEERKQKFSLLGDTIREHAEEARLDNTYPKYQNINAQILLMRGSTDNVTIHAYEKLSSLPNIQTQIWPKFDHFGAEKHPQDIAKAIANFVY